MRRTVATWLRSRPSNVIQARGDERLTKGKKSESDGEGGIVGCDHACGKSSNDGHVTRFNDTRQQGLSLLACLPADCLRAVLKYP